MSVCACSGSVAHTETAKPKPAAARPSAEPREAAAPAAPEGDASAQAAPDDSGALPERVDGGEISRARLLAVLSGGVGRFLQKVRAEPHLVAGRFVGWRLLSLFEGDPALQSGPLQPGDTVMRVNGQSIERPEQFKNAWDSLATESELVLQVQRAGKQSQVRYRIVD
jgi:S1-C subfamily serine protease